MSKLTLRYNHLLEAIELHFNNTDLKNFLSSSLPQGSRTWNKNSKCWVILPFVLGKVIAYSRHLFSQIDSSSIPIRYQRTIQKALQGIIEDEKDIKSNSSPYSTLYLTTEAPDFIVKAVYKALVFKYHPDKGGDSEQFQRVKDAYDLIIEGAS